MKRFALKVFLFSCFIFCFINTTAQTKKNKNLIYVDKQGVIRFTQNNTEAAFFGVNYTVPFAYGYRSHKKIGVDIEKAIDEDVYHFSRLGLNAFRVHVWDTEITDSLGNLKNNEHLRLFDYLIKKLKERNIKIFLTPLAFWGNGYPERDQNTGSFSSIYNKQQVLVTEAAIKAQENYLQQLLKHVNPYTNLTYENDRDIIALEINNEPKHSGTKQEASKYIDRMVKAVKNSGWTKPVFYNISESPAYADAVAQAEIDGVSFQWYPTGLVANRSLKGNFLPNVDHYKISFGDTIPQYRNKAKMVYEFDAGDIYEPYMYPAMARSFRTAGFQWATQFAYDPLATANNNTEYQTHYLNLAYTSSKAISLMIASEAFQRVPLLKNYGTYPTDSVFDVFRVSYKNLLSEMNSEEKFYYSNSTTSKPKNIFKLKNIAGVGTSSVVDYDGTGAYFLDKIDNGTWRLEVMPDAISISDPFARASPNKDVTKIIWQKQRMQIFLPDLKNNFELKPLNTGNGYTTTASVNSFYILPGSYLVVEKNISIEENIYQARIGAIEMKEFVAPKATIAEPFLMHQAFSEVSPNKSFIINATVVGVDAADKISLELRNSSDKWKTIQLNRKNAYNFFAEVPADMVTPGLINYRIIIQKGANNSFVFPGNHKGNPYAWDNYINESWQTTVASENSSIELFNAKEDRNNLMVYNPDWRSNRIEYITTSTNNQLALKAILAEGNTDRMMGWQFYFAKKIEGRKTEILSAKKLLIKASGSTKDSKIRIGLIDHYGQAFAAYIKIDADLKEIEVPLNSLQRDSSLLLPRPYPGFLPLWFTSASTASFNINDMEKIEILFIPKAEEESLFLIESIRLIK